MSAVKVTQRYCERREEAGVSDERDGPDGATTPDEGATVDTTAETSAETRRRGRLRVQDESTTPREPTLAERRARERAARREREAEEQRLSDEQAGRKKRKRVLIGSGVAAGLAAVVALGYVVAQPEEEVTANCVDESGVVVDDSNCAVPAEASNSTYYGGGGFGFFPIFIGGGGRQYHYNYGGTGVIGQPVAGGTTTVPKDGTRVRTSAGSSTVTRGGLGVSRSSTGGSSVGGSNSGGSKSGTGSGGFGGSSGGGSKSGGS
jgi:hypothetical protein